MLLCTYWSTARWIQNATVHRRRLWPDTWRGTPQLAHDFYKLFGSLRYVDLAGLLNALIASMHFVTRLCLLVLMKLEYMLSLKIFVKLHVMLAKLLTQISRCVVLSQACRRYSFGRVLKWEVRIPWCVEQTGDDVSSIISFGLTKGDHGYISENLPAGAWNGLVAIALGNRFAEKTNCLDREP